MITATGYKGQAVAVLGLSRSGLAVIRALEAGGAYPIGWDDSPIACAAGEASGAEIRDLSKHGALADIAALIVSPGIPHLYPAPHPIIEAAWAAGVPVDNDIGLFFRSFANEGFEDLAKPPRIIAVTGSNGKSTTSALIHHIITHAGHPAQLAGNIGLGVFDIEEAHSGEVIVLELSSYQTELARALTPDVAVFTNLSPDHLDRHGGQGGYFAAKRRLFAEGGPDRAVIGVDEPEGRYLANQLAGSADDTSLITVSAGRKLAGNGWTVTAKKGFLAEWRRGKQMASCDLRQIKSLPGSHNHQNACAAWAACRAINIAPRVIAAALASYPGLPHRSQHIASADGVDYVNDSKATNVDAAAHALAAFGKIRWICGGLQKEGGLAGLAPHLGNVAKAYVIGREAAQFALGLGDVESAICTDMATAVTMAMDDAQPGETVLLAPAAASFDQYDNFEQRGDDFAALVKARL